MAAESSRSILHERFEPRQSLIPLVRDDVKILLHRMERARVKSEAAFAPGADTAHKAGALEHAQVLGDGLARNARARSQLRDRRGLARAEPGHEREARLVAQRREQGRMRRLLVARVARDAA
ncbi:hypothetical protein SBA5_140043 [Candidatus Sulfotelmatomonas gaucii]|uniref:Uncharacterized protein n=1 Tax=Candidatus Sulfuritelmatomonas gaucii TaxID=2043161 RepID=A0A2N9L4E1_9BACT|nr:hypothetical protein SBA5_140043 [Candidatus Sulfotelmatomonas gaucii]